jgi:hypothetical protein
MKVWGCGKAIQCCSQRIQRFRKGDLRKSGPGVRRFMRCEKRGRSGLHTAEMLAYNWMAPG